MSDSTSRPQLDTQAVLELGNGPHIRPDFPVQDAPDGGVMNPRVLRNRMLRLAADRAGKVESEQAGSFPDRVQGLRMRPTSDEVAGRGSSGAHDPRVGDPQPTGSSSSASVGTGLNIRYSNSDVHSDVPRFIRGHRPRMSPARWEAIGDFCRACVTDFQPTTLVKARHVMWVVQNLASWAYSNGLNLNRQDLFDEMLLLSYLKQFGPTQDRTRQSLLTEVAKRLSDVDEVTNIRIGNGPPPHAPYTSSEIGQFYGWARGQSTERQRHNAIAILALTLGAGLTRNELFALTVAGIRIVESDVDVLVGNRTVPVLDLWASDVASLSVGKQADDRVFITTYLTAEPSALFKQFIQTTRGVGQKPVPSRLRATWIVQHLQAGTPLDVLLGATGFNDARSLERYLPFVVRTAQEAATVLRNAGGNR